MHVRDVRYHPRALKALTRYRGDASKITSKIAAYAENPDAQTNNVKRLKGSPPVCRLRVGDYRVIFTEGKNGIIITNIGPRGSIYD